MYTVMCNEDREDYLLGLAALEKKGPRIALEDLDREFDLEICNRKEGMSESKRFP
jgi:hypothetical protein